MATVEQMEKVRRDLRRIDKACDRLRAAYLEREVQLGKEYDPKIRTAENQRRERHITALRRYLARLELIQDQMRNMWEWVPEDLG
jgi:hypothetical protein